MRSRSEETVVTEDLSRATLIGKKECSMSEDIAAAALQPYLDDQGLSFAIENHLAAAVRPSSTGAR
jgi:hypothetical protein